MSSYVVNSLEEVRVIFSLLTNLPHYVYFLISEHFIIGHFAFSCGETNTYHQNKMQLPWSRRQSRPFTTSPSSLFLWGACLHLTATDQIWLTKINGKARKSDQFNLATVLPRNKRAHCQQGSTHFNAYSMSFCLCYVKTENCECVTFYIWMS